MGGGGAGQDAQAPAVSPSSYPDVIDHEADLGVLGCFPGNTGLSFITFGFQFLIFPPFYLKLC